MLAIHHKKDPAPGTPFILTALVSGTDADGNPYAIEGNEYEVEVEDGIIFDESCVKIGHADPDRVDAAIVFTSQSGFPVAGVFKLTVRNVLLPNESMSVDVTVVCPIEAHKADVKTTTSPSPPTTESDLVMDVPGVVTRSPNPALKPPPKKLPTWVKWVGGMTILCLIAWTGFMSWKTVFLISDSVGVLKESTKTATAKADPKDKLPQVAEPPKNPTPVGLPTSVTQAEVAPVPVSAPKQVPLLPKKKSLGEHWNTFPGTP